MRETLRAALSLACLLAFLPSCSSSERAAEKSPTALTAAETDSLLRFYARERAETEEWLQSKPTSYLATVQRRDFESRASLTVGSAAGSDVRIEDPAVQPRHLRVTVAGDSFQVRALDRGAAFQVKESTMTSATLPPTAIQVGRFTLRLSHQRFPAIIVFDPQSPRFKLYKGLKFFPPDVSYRVVTALTPNPNTDTTIILSTRGNRRRSVRVGWFDFTLNGKRCRLEASRLLEPGVGEKDISLFFTDATTGTSSYSVGRYLDPEPLPDGRYVLDFNRCYNPACAYSEDYNCPIPPTANRLQVAVNAGEMDAHYMH